MNVKENSKNKLVKTASRLFQLQGYHATGLNQITQESGAPKGSLYYHFPNGKEELAIESVQATADFVSSQIEQGLSSSTDAVEAIQTFITDMAERFQKEHRAGGIPIAAVALETSLISGPLREACQSAYQQFQNAFTEKLIQSGYEEERARELGSVINLMIEGAFLISFTTGDSKPLFLVAKQIPVLLK
ncbi:TetR/AcrR family transcriptional regulator [Planococcus sp. CP5-4]|uniref:TetR/AcrR family transcriptional regulator n=1 Tax=unclassified Planococcus (in: firmicutes) TaxID=2662419 RepID=UPI001C21B883|nr:MULTISPECIES: TetR/AcrR family transcriptional regulator [unclassified Planococcus (in: firmicutes)]MBU9673773.1 TetR/AcrR family transcriptional regulator [Planococcus sp. CP5-4_YE]MBV0908901.1 TetR/AcrR family transcriptional regulator [Planococcus sp. CP5-4_UN]MBW6063950.1 TetR/AcrR family transcriptional regulator [Planococcus sp. CP5-4]